MARIVPYRSNGSARAMMARALTSTGSRASGGWGNVAPAHVGPIDRRRGAGGPAPAPGPGLAYDAPSGLPYVPYEAAKRMGLGSLGTAATIATQAYKGYGTGAATAGIATSIGTSVATAVGAGAAAGSVVPIIGTAIGAIVGLIASGVFNRKKDKEDANFQQAMAIYRQNPNGVYDIGNKYLVLAGLFDLHPDQIKGNIPIYKKYGRMGEQKFVTDMMTLIYQAAQTGRITANDTPQSIFARIVQPWIDGFGFGAMSDSNTDMINRILLGMIAEYVMGGQSVWSAVGGQYPFTSLPKFALPPVYTAPAPAPAAIAAPAPVYTAPAPMYTAPALPQVQATVPTVVQPAPTVVPPPGSTVPPTAVPPTGFNVVGQDASGAPVFASPQGVLYQWTGSAMQQFTGQLATNSSQAAQMQAAIQNALAQGYSSGQAAQMAVAQQQAAGAPVPPAIQAQVADQAATTAGAPTYTAAGIGGSLGNTAAILSIGATVLGLMFATARPAKQPRQRRRA